MNLYAKFDQNMSCCSRVMSTLLTAHGQTDRRTDGQTHIVMIVQAQGSSRIIVQTILIIVQAQGSCNFNLTSKPRVVQYSAGPRVVEFYSDHKGYIGI